MNLTDLSIHWFLVFLFKIQEKQRRQEEQRKRHLEAAALLSERNADGYVDEKCQKRLGAHGLCFKHISICVCLSALIISGNRGDDSGVFFVFFFFKKGGRIW